MIRLSLNRNDAQHSDEAGGLLARPLHRIESPFRRRRVVEDPIGKIDKQVHTSDLQLQKHRKQLSHGMKDDDKSQTPSQKKKKASLTPTHRVLPVVDPGKVPQKLVESNAVLLTKSVAAVLRTAEPSYDVSESASSHASSERRRSYIGNCRSDPVPLHTHLAPPTRRRRKSIGDVSEMRDDSLSSLSSTSTLNAEHVLPVILPLSRRRGPLNQMLDQEHALSMEQRRNTLGTSEHVLVPKSPQRYLVGGSQVASTRRLVKKPSNKQLQSSRKQRPTPSRSSSATHLSVSPRTSSHAYHISEQSAMTSLSSHLEDEPKIKPELCRPTSPDSHHNTSSLSVGVSTPKSRGPRKDTLFLPEGKKRPLASLPGRTIHSMCLDELPHNTTLSSPRRRRQSSRTSQPLPMRRTSATSASPFPEIRRLPRSPDGNQSPATLPFERQSSCPTFPTGGPLIGETCAADNDRVQTPKTKTKFRLVTSRTNSASKLKKKKVDDTVMSPNSGSGPKVMKKLPHVPKKSPAKNQTEYPTTRQSTQPVNVSRKIPTSKLRRRASVTISSPKNPERFQLGNKSASLHDFRAGKTKKSTRLSRVTTFGPPESPSSARTPDTLASSWGDLSFMLHDMDNLNVGKPLRGPLSKVEVKSPAKQREPTRGAARTHSWGNMSLGEMLSPHNSRFPGMLGLMPAHLRPRRGRRPQKQSADRQGNFESDTTE